MTANLGDLYDLGPNVIHLVGGPYDGYRIPIPDRDWPPRWLMPVQPPSITLPLVAEPDLSPVTRHQAYDYTDSLNDNGERAYRYVGEH
ncbi:hypothetical protein AB0O28_18935 [Microbispora sp. NPDC088329]|uniref:hypothetical protein n=1 Tax=Microbispora sp. NPDC088329 TaxID=3154869 RepID=UPI0034147DDC